MTDEKKKDQQTPDPAPTDAPGQGTGADAETPVGATASPDPAETPADSQDGSVGDSGPDEAPDETPSKRAVRERAQAAEGRVSELESRVAELEQALAGSQRQTVARIAESQRRPDFPAVPGASLHDGNHLFDNAGYGVDSFLADDGSVSPDLVAEIVTKVLAENPALGRRSSPKPDPSLGQGTPVGGASTNGWHSLLQRGR